jgi:hypothetical protein
MCLKLNLQQLSQERAFLGFVVNKATGHMTLWNENYAILTVIIFYRYFINNGDCTENRIKTDSIIFRHTFLMGFEPISLL